MDFETYFEEVKSQLTCNASEAYKSEHVTYGFPEEIVVKNEAYFRDCYRKDLSAYKALLYFGFYLNELN